MQTRRPAFGVPTFALLAVGMVGTVAVATACSAQTVVTSTDVIATRDRLIRDQFCSGVAVVTSSGVLPAHTPAARLVERSIGCGPHQDEPTIVLSQFRSAADRDKACASMRTDAAVLCGTDLRLWLMRVGDDVNIDRIEVTFGDDVVRAAADT